jgi:hypothetical protein
MAAFLSFLAADMTTSPHRIKPWDRSLAGRIDSLAGDLPLRPHEDLGDDRLV